MNNQFDISKQTNYLERKMFLDEAGPVSLQRFDKVKYQKLQQYEKIARGYFWVPEEIDITKDRQDMKNASVPVKHMFTSNILRQTVLDSLQGKAPLQIFGPVCSLPELEVLLSTWGFFESAIHSNSYSHIIRGAYTNPAEVFDKVHEIEEIVGMANEIGKYYNALDDMNCKVSAGIPVDRYEHKKAIWMALHASYALEAIRFMVSFATSFCMMENKIFIGNGTIIGLILQDELLHTEWSAWILNQVCKEDADFLKIQSETKEEVYQLYENVIREEKEWANYLCSEGAIIGLNTKTLHSFVDWTANEKLKDIGIKYRGESPKSHPIPWFLKHVNLDTKQTALQELESTSYIISALDTNIKFDDLPTLD